jgi:flagellar basal body P-ring protein FlgI
VSVGTASVSHHGLTLEVSANPTNTTSTAGFVHVARGAQVEDVAAALHAAGARPEEVAAVFEALHAAGALRVQVVVR